MNPNRSGVYYFLAGVRMLNKRGLRRYLVIPLIINIVLYAAMLYLAIHFYSHLTAWIDTLLPRWLQWLNWLLWILFVISSFIVITYTFTLFANLIGAPFNGFLSAAVEKRLTGSKEISSSGWQIIYKEIPRAVARQLQFIVYYITRAVIVLILFFIPGLQLIAGPLWFLLNSWMMAVQYMDYPMDNHHISFKEMRKRLSEYRWANFGFGSMVMLATLIPIVNFIVMPAAVIGATLLFVDQSREK